MVDAWTQVPHPMKTARTSASRPLLKLLVLMITISMSVELSEADADKWLPLLLALKLPDSVSAVGASRTLAPGFEEAREIRQPQRRLTPDERAPVARKYGRCHRRQSRR
jgi:hypothetical protein